MGKRKNVLLGSTACISHPSISCSKNIERIETIKNAIGKVFFHEDTIDTEWNISKKLYKIDPTQKHFIYPLEKCYVLPKDISNECPAKKLTAPIQLKSKYAPDTLLNYIIRYTGETLSPLWFLQNVYYLLNSLELLHKKGIIHNDIKYNNIVVDKDSLWKYIDFGVSVRKQDYYNLDKNYVLYTDYMIHPPEIRYFMRYYFIDKNIETFEQFVNNEWYLLHFFITENNYQNIDMYKYYYTYDDYQKQLQNMFSKLKSKSKSEVKKYLQKHVEKVDIYSLGLTLSHCYPYINIQKDDICYKIFILIQHMVHPNIFERWSLKECKKYVEKAIAVLGEGIYTQVLV